MVSTQEILTTNPPIGDLCTPVSAYVRSESPDKHRLDSASHKQPTKLSANYRRNFPAIRFTDFFAETVLLKSSSLH